MVLTAHALEGQRDSGAKLQDVGGDDELTALALPDNHNDDERAVYASDSVLLGYVDTCMSSARIVDRYYCT